MASEKKPDLESVSTVLIWSAWLGGRYWMSIILSPKVQVLRDYKRHTALSHWFLVLPIFKALPGLDLLLSSLPSLIFLWSQGLMKISRNVDHLPNFVILECSMWKMSCFENVIQMLAPRCGVRGSWIPHGWPWFEFLSQTLEKHTWLLCVCVCLPRSQQDGEEEGAVAWPHSVWLFLYLCLWQVHSGDTKNKQTNKKRQTVCVNWVKTEWA